MMLFERFAESLMCPVSIILAAQTRERYESSRFQAKATPYYMIVKMLEWFRHTGR